MIAIRVTAEHKGQAAIWLDKHGDLELVSMHTSHNEAMREAQLLARDLRRELRQQPIPE